MNDDLEAEQILLKNLLASVAEHYKDFLIITRGDDINLLWTMTDKTWARGAAQRFCVMTDAHDKKSAS